RLRPRDGAPRPPPGGGGAPQGPQGGALGAARALQELRRLQPGLHAARHDPRVQGPQRDRLRPALRHQEGLRAERHRHPLPPPDARGQGRRSGQGAHALRGLPRRSPEEALSPPLLASLVKGPKNAMSAKSAKDATKGDFATLALFALFAFFGPARPARQAIRARARSRVDPKAPTCRRLPGARRPWSPCPIALRASLPGGTSGG